MVTGYAGQQYQEVYLNYLFYATFDCKCMLTCFIPVNIFMKVVPLTISEVEVQNFGTNWPPGVIIWY